MTVDYEPGKGSNAKVIQYELIEGDTNYKLIELSQRHRQALIASCTYLRWMSRHAALPSDLVTNDMLDAWVSDLELRLMTDIDFCARMIGCINEDEDVRTALYNLISAAIGDFNSSGGYGTPMSNQQLIQDIAAGTNPTCDLDVLFAQCRFIVKNTHEAVTEVLQDVELTSNAFEIAKNLWDSIPVIGATDEALGADGWTNMALYWQEAVNETYEAQWSEVAGDIYDKLSYRLFCKCRNDCVINVDRILESYQDALEQYIAAPSLAGLSTLLSVLAGLDQSTTFVVELAHYVAWGLVKLIKFLFGRKYDDFIALAMELKADEPDNDWETLETIFGACPTEICMTPVILTTEWFGIPANSGTNIQEVVGEDCYYTIDATTLPDTTETIGFEEEQGEEFIIEDITYPTGITTGVIVYEQGGTNHVASGTPSILSGITKFGIGYQSGTEPGQIKFKMYRIG